MQRQSYRILPIAVIAAVGFSILSFQNCSKAAFGTSETTSASSTVEGLTTTGTTSATCAVTTTAENLRILFMVDNSSSTATTDPAKKYRMAAIQKFIANYGTHTNLTYGFGYFSGTSGLLYDSTQAQFSASPTTAFYSAASLTAALTKYDTIGYLGGTPYKAAFSTLSSAISADANANSSNYVVVFLSDGAPTDLSANIDSDIKALVASLNSVVLGKGRLLTVNTVYFGPENDSAAQEHLELMADDASGQYVDTNGSNSLEVEDVITVPGC